MLHVQYSPITTFVIPVTTDGLTIVSSNHTAVMRSRVNSNKNFTILISVASPYSMLLYSFLILFVYSISKAMLQLYYILLYAEKFTHH